MTTRVSADAKLQHVPADIEANYPNWDPQVVHSNGESHFWSVAGDKHGQRVLFTDIR